MLSLAKKLSVDIPHIRVDFYELQGEGGTTTLFGELTFFPEAGYGKFMPQEWDYKFGMWIEIW
jgi:hypothetical protein